MTMEEQFEQTTLDERKPVTESSMLEEDSASTEPALMSSSQSRDNNTYSSISSSDFGEQVSSLQSQQLTTQEVLSEEQALTEEDFQRMMSSYENVYDGVQLTPDVNRLSMNASELDIGDRFDTKQLDMHLQPTGRSSSFEQLYQEEIGERPAEESKLAEQSAYPIKPIEGEFNQQAMTASSSLSSSSLVSKEQSAGGKKLKSKQHKRSVRFRSDHSPVHITVESGLDTLGCDDPLGQTQDPPHVETWERTYSWDPDWDQTRCRNRTYSTPGKTSNWVMSPIYQEKGIALC